MAENKADAYGWWRRALAGEKVGGPTLPVHDGDPMPGYYRKKAKGDGWHAVAIWPDAESGDMQALINGRETSAEDIWTWCCKNPVSWEDYRAVVEGGKPWPDEAPAAVPAPIGHNMPDDPAEAARLEYEGELEAAETFLAKPVTDQNQADKVGPWAKRLSALKKKAEDCHKQEKAPHLQAGRDVDAKWKPLVSDVAELIKSLKAHIQPFLDQQRREEQARVRAEKEKAEQLRREAAEAARKAEADEAAQQEAIDLTQKAAEAEERAKAKNATAGRTGAKVTLRTERRAKVVNYEAAALAMLKANHTELKEKIEQLAQRAVRAGVAIDGVEIEEISKVA